MKFSVQNMLFQAGDKVLYDIDEMNDEILDDLFFPNAIKKLKDKKIYTIKKVESWEKIDFVPGITDDGYGCTDMKTISKLCFTLKEISGKYKFDEDLFIGVTPSLLTKYDLLIIE